MNTPTLNITLKAFKHIKTMSRETLCFTATVCLDGKVIAHAENQGHGGCTYIWLTDLGKADPAVANCGSLASLVDAQAYALEQAAEDARLRKRVAKDLATTVMFTRRGDAVGGCRVLKQKYATPAETIAAAKDFAARQPDVECVFNLLPFEQAFARLVQNA
jgi:hypothetical protein